MLFKELVFVRENYIQVVAFLFFLQNYILLNQLGADILKTMFE